MNADNPIAFAEPMMQSMREFFERDGHLDPVAILLATRDADTLEPFEEPQSVIVPLYFGNQEDKEEAIISIRELAAKTAAVGVLCGFEAWVCKTDDPEELGRGLENGTEKHPSPEEMVYVRLEHRSGEVVWTAPIARNTEGRPSLAAFKLEPNSQIGVRFKNLLPAQVVPVAPRFDA